MAKSKRHSKKSHKSRKSHRKSNVMKSFKGVRVGDMHSFQSVADDKKMRTSIIKIYKSRKRNPKNGRRTVMAVGQTEKSSQKDGKVYAILGNVK